MNTLDHPFTSPADPAALVPPKRFATVEETQRYLKSQGVAYVLAQFVDIHGVAKAKSVPLAHLETVLTDGAGFAGFAIWGVGIEPHGPDFMAVGDLRCVSLVPLMSHWITSSLAVAMIHRSPERYCIAEMPASSA